jgi:hypothetical protein
LLLNIIFPVSAVVELTAAGVEPRAGDGVVAGITSTAVLN